MRIKTQHLQYLLAVIAIEGCADAPQDVSPPGTESVTQNAATPPDPANKAYLNYFEQQSGTPNENWNYKAWPNGTRTVQIAGKRIVLDSADVNGLLARFEGDSGKFGDVKRLDIYAETLVVRKVVRVPGAEIHIHAEQLRFEDVAGQPPAAIDTSPVATPSQAGQTLPGVDGMPGGAVYAAVKSFFSDQDRAPRFILNGGPGQAGGAGSNGGAGTPRQLLSATRRDLITCAASGQAMSEGTPTFNDNGSSPGRWTVQPAGLTFAELQNQVVELGQDFPTNGFNAISGGRPGSGGNGGKLHVATALDLMRYTQAQPGAPGASAGAYQGGSPGTPMTAIRFDQATCQTVSATDLVVNGGSVSLVPATLRYLKIQGLQRRVIQAGQGASAPVADHVASGGSKIADLGNFAWYHPHALAMTIAFAEDAFANGFRDLASTELTRQDATLQQLLQSADFASLSLDDRTLLTQYSLRIKSLLNQLLSHEDYWGNPQNWVPELSLEANLTLYQQEVQWAIRTMFVADWLTNKNNQVKDKVAALEQAKGLLRKEIDSQQALFDAAVARLPGLKQDAVNASDAIASLTLHLQAVELRLTARADQNVRDRLKLPFWKKALRVLIVAAKVLPVPAIQPALAGIATGLDTLIDFDSDKPWDSLPGAVDAIKTFAKTDIDKKAKDVKDKKDEKKPEEKATKPDLRETLADLQKTAEPVITALKQQKQRFTDQEVKKDDLDKQIAAELEKLKGEDPEYQQIAIEVTTVNDTRAQLAKSITDATTTLEQAVAKISEYWLQYSELLPQISGQVASIASQRALIALTDLRGKAFRRLQKYQYLLSRAYKYRMLREYPGDLTLTNLFNEMVKLVQGSAQNGVLQAADYDHLYALYREDISAIVETIVDEYSHGQRRYDTVSLSYDLSQDELARINAGSTVELNFWERGAFQAKDEDVRIVKLEVTDMQIDQIGSGDFAYVDLDTEHPGISRVWRDGQVSVFQHYNKSRLQPLHWATRWQNGALTQFLPSASSESLLRSLIPDAATDIMLFSRPSAWAPLALRKLVHGTNGVDFQIRSARVKLTYDFTTGTSSTTWQQYRDGQNATLQPIYQGLLQRAAPPDELTSARRLLDMGYTTDAVSTIIRQSHAEEYFGVRVTSIYNQLYQRLPTDIEREFWAKELMNGRTEAQTTAYVKAITDRYGAAATVEDLEQSTSRLDHGGPLTCPGTGDSVSADLLPGIRATFTIGSIAMNCSTSHISGTLDNASDPLAGALTPMTFIGCSTSIGFAATTTTNSTNGGWGLGISCNGPSKLHIPQAGAVMRYATSTVTLAPAGAIDIPVTYTFDTDTLTIEADVPITCTGVLCPPNVSTTRLQATYRINH